MTSPSFWKMITSSLFMLVHLPVMSFNEIAPAQFVLRPITIDAYRPILADFTITSPNFSGRKVYRKHDYLHVILKE